MTSSTGENSSANVSDIINTSDAPETSGSTFAPVINPEYDPEPTDFDPTKELPFTLYGPDNKQLTYGDVGLAYLGYNMKTVPVHALTEDNWHTICAHQFAYVPVSHGAYYNSVDNPEAFTEDFEYNADAEFTRVSVGDRFGDFKVVVAGAYFRARSNGMTASEMTENNIPLSNLYYFSQLGLRGNAIIDGYLVKSDGDYYLVPENGTQIPAMNYDIRDDGSFGTYLISGNLSGFEYKSEIPAIRINVSPAREATYGKYFEGQNYRKVRVNIQNMSICYCRESANRYTVTANEYEIVGIQLGDSDDEPAEISNAIDSYRSIQKLKTGLTEKFGFTDVRVIETINYFNDNLGKEITEGTLEDGNKVAVYDENRLCGIYTCNNGFYLN